MPQIYNFRNTQIKTIIIEEIVFLFSITTQLYYFHGLPVPYYCESSEIGKKIMWKSITILNTHLNPPQT